MKRILVLLAVVGLGLVSMLPASADHGTFNYFVTNFQGGRWNETVQRDFCYSDDFSAFPTQTWLNAVDSIDTMITRVETDTDLNNIFTMTGPCGSFNASQTYANSSGEGDFCNGIPLAWRSSVQYENFPASLDNYAGLTVTCDRDSDPNLRIDYAVVMINSSAWGDWHFAMDPFPAQGEGDFPGLFMHEFVHAIGWDGVHLHTSFCTPTQAAWETICQGTWGWIHTSNSAGTANRTLEGHETGEINQHY